MTFGIFEEIERLIEYIPIENGNDFTSFGGGRLADGVTIDSQYYFKDVDGVATRLGVIEPGRNTVCIKDIVKLLNKFLKDAKIEEILDNKNRYRQVQNSGSGLPLKNLLFDFCLAALVGDIADARLYLNHSFHLLGLHKRLALLLSLIINDHRASSQTSQTSQSLQSSQSSQSSASTTNSDLSEDSDIRQLLVMLALISEPNNINVYFDSDGDGFDERYRVYLHEVQRISKLQRVYKSGSAARNNIVTTTSITTESI
jgi:hypothetical protein